MRIKDKNKVLALKSLNKRFLKLEGQELSACLVEIQINVTMPDRQDKFSLLYL